MPEIIVTTKEALRSEISAAIRESFTPGELATRKDAANFFGVSVLTIDDWVKRGIIPAYRIGNCVRFKRVELEAELKRIQNG